MKKPPRPDSPSRRQMLALSAGALTALGCRASAPASPLDSTMEPDPELDDLFADLEDQRPLHRPITAQEKAVRRQQLGRLLADRGLDALLVEASPTLTYLSDVTWGRSERLFALIVLADGSSFWIAPAFEVPRAEEKIREAGGPAGPVIAWDEHEYAWAPLAAALRERGVERIAIEPSSRAFVPFALARELGSDRVVDGTELVIALRGVKEPHELALLRAANEITQRAIVAVSERLRPGMTDHDVARWMRHAQQRMGLTGVWVLALLDEGAAYPHGRASGETLEKGDLVLVDTGGALHGYQSDNTRTWIFDGAPSAEVERGWNAVRDAQKRAYETIRPGIPASEVDAAARGVLTEAGYGPGYEAFAHRLGHGIGLEGHESPNFDGGSGTILAPGMTFSDEPGIYLPGRFGIRIEDIVAVTAEGADHFGNWQQGPRSPA